MMTYVKESRVNFDVELMSKMILHILHKVGVFIE